MGNGARCTTAGMPGAPRATDGAVLRARGAPGAPAAPPAPSDEAEDEVGLETLSDEEDFQLQRALDLLKTWDIFHQNQGANAAKTD